MLLTVTTAGWRLRDSDDDFEYTHALSPQSHLELNWFEAASGEMLTEVWVSLFLTESDPMRKLMIYRMDAQDLEWRFAFEGAPDSLTIPLDWSRVDERSREVTLINDGVPRNLRDEIGASPAA